MFRRTAIVIAALLLMAGGSAAQSPGSGSAAAGNVNIDNKSSAISSDVKSGPDGSTLGTAKSAGVSGDATLSNAKPDKGDPSLLKSNRDIERALKSICRGC